MFDGLPSISAIDLSTNVITTAASHNLQTRYAVAFKLGTAGVLPTSTPQVATTGIYFARRTGAATLTLHTTDADAAAGASAIDFTGAQTNTVYIAPLSLRERIERNIYATLAAISGVSGVQRWRAQGNSKANLSIVVFAGDTQTAPSAEGADGGYMADTCDYTLRLCLAQPDGDSEDTAEIIARWAALLRKAVMADPTRGGVTIPPNTQIVGDDAAEVVDGQPEIYVTVRMEVTYRTSETDPYLPQ